MCLSVLYVTKCLENYHTYTEIKQTPFLSFQDLETSNNFDVSLCFAVYSISYKKIIPFHTSEFRASLVS